MPTIILPYGVTKQIRVVGKNAANTQERPITNLAVTSSSSSVSVTPTVDPNVFNVTDNSTTLTTTGTLNATGKNELNANVNGSTPMQLQPPDPATTIEITEL